MSTAAVALGTGAISSNRALAQPFFRGNPFSLGVASGDPLPDSLVIWTRLAPDPLAEDGSGGMPPQDFGVRYEVATDEGFRRIVRRGAVEATPELAHSVHAEIGGLQPGREYFYRFKAGPEVSPVGRTRTAPTPAASLNALAFAFVSCQNYPAGFYNAFANLAREDLDVVFHLGDYIYEGGFQGNLGRGHAPAREISSLADHRVRYAQYKADPDLRAAHAAFPWVVTWDDHEVDNNYADEISQDFPGVSREEFLQRRAIAYKAYYEHQPLGRQRLPQGPDLRLYRRFTFGDLAEFNVLDTRQYRDDQAGSGRDVPKPEQRDPSRTITGDGQEQWLLEGLARSSATWNVLAQQVFFSQRDFELGPGEIYNYDAWDGYLGSRQRLISGITERNVRNPVVLTGDVHQNYAVDIKEDFDDPDSATVGSEFVGTSISTGGNGSDTTQGGQEQMEENPHIKFYNQQRGYVRCTLTPDQYRADYRVVPHVTEPGAPIYTRASFAVEAGNPGIQQVDSNPVQGRKFSDPPQFEAEMQEARQKLDRRRGGSGQRGRSRQRR